MLNLWTPRLLRSAWGIPLQIADARSWLRCRVGATRLNNLEAASGIVPSETSAAPNRSCSTTSVSARHRTGRRLSGAGVPTTARTSKGQCHPGWSNQSAKTGRAASTRSSGAHKVRIACSRGARRSAHPLTIRPACRCRPKTVLANSAAERTAAAPPLPVS